MFEGANEFQNGVLIGLARQSGQQIAGAERVADRAMDLLEQAKARIAELELALAVKTAHAGGLEAQLKSFIAAHPASPVRADSGRRYATGAVKTVGHLSYEEAFDRIARDKGISNPVEHRAN